MKCVSVGLLTGESEPTGTQQKKMKPLEDCGGLFSAMSFIKQDQVSQIYRVKNALLESGENTAFNWLYLI